MPPKKKPKLKKAKPTLKQKQSQIQNVTVNVGAQEKPKRKRKPRAKKAATVASSLGLVAPSQEQGFARYIYPTQTQQNNSLITDELKSYLKQIHGGVKADNLQIEPQAPEQPPAMPALPAPAPEETPLAPRKPEITLLSTRIRPKVKIDNPPVEDDDDDDASSVAGSVRDITDDDLSGFGKGNPSKAKQNLGGAAEAPPVEQSPEKQTLDNIVSPGKTRAPRRSKEQMAADKAIEEQKKEENRIAREVKKAAAAAAKEEKRKEKKLGSIREE